MNYEKEYKKLKADISKAYLYAQTDSTKAVLETIFPELKESEDERIRKELIAIFKREIPYTPYTSEEDAKRYIAWLEKQGGITKLSEEEQNRFAKGVLSSCAMSFINYLDAHKYEGKMCVSNGECEDIENAFHNAMWDRLHTYYCKYVEKQGEYKSSEEVLKIRQELYQSGYNDGYKHGCEDSKKQDEKLQGKTALEAIKEVYLCILTHEDGRFKMIVGCFYDYERAVKYADGSPWITIQRQSVI